MKQVINIGAAPNDGTGDPLRTAFTKANENFTEVYDAADANADAAADAAAAAGTALGVANAAGAAAAVAQANADSAGTLAVSAGNAAAAAQADAATALTNAATAASAAATALAAANEADDTADAAQATANTALANAATAQSAANAAQATASAAVVSVNGETGTVILDAADVGAAGTSTNTFTGTQRIDSAEPRYLFSETDRGTDLKLWDIDISAGVMTFRTRTDADGAGVNAIAITRGATTAINTIAFGNATNNPTHTFLGTGQATFGGAITVTADINGQSRFYCSGGTPSYTWVETDLGADLKRWRQDVAAGVWKLRTMTDADGTGVDVISVVRGTTTAIASMAFGNAANNPTYTFLGTGAAIYQGPIRMAGFTVATLPAGTQGDRAYVTDALTPTFLAAIVGGGAVVCPVFKNATAWVAG